jgi:glycosyltransferase involved in cell wall biosynthesis
MGLVSISDAQRDPIPFANFAGTVHHGLPRNLLKPTFDPRGGYFAFLGRISPEKRVDRAIAIARAVGFRLKIAAKVDAVDVEYFERMIKPLLVGDDVEFVGEIGDRDKSAFIGEAAALMFPIDWPEPFGMVMIEAMACGTPVLAFDCGSVREVIDEGVTGFIVDSTEAAVATVPQLLALDRREIRRRFEERFTSAAMAKAYVELYARALVSATPRPTLVHSEEPPLAASEALVN